MGGFCVSDLCLLLVEFDGGCEQRSVGAMCEEVGGVFGGRRRVHTFLMGRLGRVRHLAGAIGFGCTARFVGHSRCSIVVFSVFRGAVSRGRGCVFGFGYIFLRGIGLCLCRFYGARDAVNFFGTVDVDVLLSIVLLGLRVCRSGKEVICRVV